METRHLPEAAVNAYMQLLELNMASWRPQVAAWLHSADAEVPLRALLENVPCSPTLH